MSVLRDLFGAGTWGTGGNMVAWVICGAFAGLWLRAKMKAHHLAQLAQAARHHKELMAQAAGHHEDIKQQLAVHCSDLKEHVTASAKPVVVAPKRGGR